MIFNNLKLPSASFNGVQFYYRESSVTGGRKTVTFEYPNSSRRFVEDLGGLKKTYNITAIIDNSVNYNNRNALLNELENKQGSGTLIHPEFGRVIVKSTIYDVSNSVNSFGISTISMKFEASDDTSSVSQITSNSSIIGRLVSALRETISNNFENEYKIVSNSVDFVNRTTSAINQNATDLLQLSSLVENGGSSFSNFSSAIDNLKNNTSALINSPKILINNFNSAFDNLINSNVNKTLLTDRLLLLVKSPIPSKSSSVINRTIENNINLLNQVISNSSLLLVYSLTPEITFTNNDQLQNFRNNVEDSYNNISSSLNSGIYNQFQQVRLNFFNLINKLSVNLPNIRTINSNNISINTLSFQLYNDTSNTKRLIDLNTFNNLSNINGDISVLDNG